MYCESGRWGVVPGTQPAAEYASSSKTKSAERTNLKNKFLDFESCRKS